MPTARSFAVRPAVILEEAKRPKNLQGTPLEDDGGWFDLATRPTKY
ncbi:MAG: hypothetical protein IIV03_06905 [Clostridia bacterium]|nr:hypothetical protein [Clostridia bacterium]